MVEHGVNTSESCQDAIKEDMRSFGPSLDRQSKQIPQHGKENRRQLAD